MNSCNRNHDQRSELTRAQKMLRGQIEKSKMEEMSFVEKH